MTETFASRSKSSCSRGAQRTLDESLLDALTTLIEDVEARGEDASELLQIMHRQVSEEITDDDEKLLNSSIGRDSGH